MSDAADAIELPVKRTTGDTMEQRLTNNAYHNILPARYLKKDADAALRMLRDHVETLRGEL